MISLLENLPLMRSNNFRNNVAILEGAVGPFVGKKRKKGSEKMRMNEEENENEITMNVAERLPELDEEEVSMALSHQQLAWCHGFMNNHKDGQMFYLESCGVHLQRVNETESRCVALVDHPYCYATLAMMTLSFEKAGIDLQVDPYTVVIPHEPRDEKEVPHETGVEVA